MRWKDGRRSQNVIDLRPMAAWLPIEQLGPIEPQARTEVPGPPVEIEPMDEGGSYGGQRVGIQLETMLYPTIHSAVVVLRGAGFEVTAFTQSPLTFALAFSAEGHLLTERLTLACTESTLVLSAQSFGPLGTTVLLDWGYAEAAMKRAVNALAAEYGWSFCSFLYDMP